MQSAGLGLRVLPKHGAFIACLQGCCSKKGRIGIQKREGKTRSSAKMLELASGDVYWVFWDFSLGPFEVVISCALSRAYEKQATKGNSGANPKGSQKTNARERN